MTILVSAMRRNVELAVFFPLHPIVMAVCLTGGRTILRKVHYLAKRSREELCFSRISLFDYATRLHFDRLLALGMALAQALKLVDRNIWREISHQKGTITLRSRSISH